MLAVSSTSLANSKTRQNMGYTHYIQSVYSIPHSLPWQAQLNASRMCGSLDFSYTGFLHVYIISQSHN